MATAFALPLVDGYEDLTGFYVPLSYESVRVRRSLPARVLSRVRCTDPRQRDVPVFDIDIAAPDGEPLVEIRGFAMVRVEQIASGPDSSVAHEPARGAAPSGGASSVRAGRGTPSEAILETMISSTDGMEVLEHILSSPLSPQVVVCNRDVGTILERLREESRAASGSSASSEAQAGRQRSNRSTQFVAAENELQEQLIEIWNDVLGAEDIGIHDNFFELGGHSLLLTQIVKRVRAISQTEVPLHMLFEHMTVAALGRDIEELRSDGNAGPELTIKRVSRESHRVKR